MFARGLTAVALLASLNYSSPAAAGGPLVRFEGGIGVHPVAAIVNGAVVVNTVRGVPPGGRPWAIQELKAQVWGDGRIRARGEGLVLAATDNIGMRGGVLQVAATLFCGDLPFSSGAFELSPGGDFDIRGMLDIVPPKPCQAPVLLIRNATGGQLGGWFAAGTFRDDN